MNAEDEARGLRALQNIERKERERDWRENRADQALCVVEECAPILEEFVADISPKGSSYVEREIKIDTIAFEVWGRNEADDYTQERKHCIFTNATVFVRMNSRSALIWISDDRQRRISLRKTGQQSPWRCETMRLRDTGRRAGFRRIGAAPASEF